MANREQLIEGVQCGWCGEHVAVSFTAPWRVLSSAVLNGGFVEAGHIVNMKVDDHDCSSRSCEPPGQSIASYCEGRWAGPIVGMMTSAPMKSVRRAAADLEDEQIAVVITTGLSNPRRAGDRADVTGLHSELAETGTINTIVVTTARLSRAAMVESVMVVSEAKAVALAELGVMSPVSGLTATGTGTDAIAVACPPRGRSVKYAGKHVQFGETLARLVIRAIKDSIGIQ